MSGFVLDSSAVLAVLFSETGEDMVTPVSAGSLLCSVNASEVLKKAMDRGSEIETAYSAMSRLRMLEVPFDSDLGLATAVLGNRFRRSGLSFADCACVALALRRGLPVLTSDRRWSRFDLGVDVRQIRGPGRLR